MKPFILSFIPSLVLLAQATITINGNSTTITPGQSLTVTISAAPLTTTPPPPPPLDYSDLCIQAATGLPALPVGVVLPTLPLSCPHVVYPTPASTVTVSTSVDLQSAINAAAATCNVHIIVTASLSGNWTLPASNCGANPILIEGATIASLPPRHYPSAAIAGTLGIVTLTGTANNSAAIQVLDGANGYYLSGMEVTLAHAVTGGCTGNSACAIVGSGESTTTVAALPQNITFDRMLIHPAPCLADSVTAPCHYAIRGLDLNVVNGAVIYSNIYGIVAAGQDTQAIAIMNSTGPYMIAGNHLEATGENFISNTSCTDNPGGYSMTGAPLGSQGWDSKDQGIPSCPAPSDGTVRINHFTKQLAWQTMPTGCVFAANTCYDVKNLFEIKHGQRVLVDSNWFDTSYNGAQGEAYISNCFAQGIYVCRDQTVTNNLFEHLPSLGAFSGNGAVAPSTTCGAAGQPACTVQAGVNFLFRNNIVTDVNAVEYGGPGCNSTTASGCGTGTSWQFQNTANVTVDHNTIINYPPLAPNGMAPNGVAGLEFGNNPPSTNAAFRWTNNIQFGQPNANGSAAGGAIAGLPSPMFTNAIFVGDWWEGLGRFGLANAPAYPSGIVSVVSAATEPAPVGVTGNTATSGQLSCQYANYPLSFCWPVDWALVGFVDFAGGSVGTDIPGLALVATSPYAKLDQGADVGANVQAVKAATSTIQ